MCSYGRIYGLNTLVFVFFDCVEVNLELVVVLINYLFVCRKVDDKSNRQIIENIPMTRFTGFVHLMENLVLLC